MRSTYLTAKSSGLTSSNWWVPDNIRNPMELGLAVFDPANAGWILNVTMDDPTGTNWNPNPGLNPGRSVGFSGFGSSGAAVQSFGSSQVGGYGGNTSSGVSVNNAMYCFGAGTGAAIGAIMQPIMALQFTSTANVAAGTTSSGVPVLSIIQPGPR